MGEREGVCTGCEKVVPLHRHVPTEDELAAMDDGFGNPAEVVYYSVADHDLYGELCQGSGLCPQFLVKK